MSTPKKGTQYFTQDTEDAIVLYNNTDDSSIRSKIYSDRIHYAFFKLTENIIHTFKFYYTEVDNIEDLQHEIITFLLTKIHLFDPSKGAKAYSYFGTIVKRYLIINNTKNYKKRVDKAPVTEIEADDKFSYSISDVTEPTQNDKLYMFMDEYVEYCTKNIYELFPKENDAKIADAILELFRKRDNIDIFNKKALYIYIREIIDVKTPKITKIADRLYDIFKEHYLFYLENGYTNF
jgi:DNA-directed RNA polymerase specialized sigma24 family protein